MERHIRDRTEHDADFGPILVPLGARYDIT